MRGPERISRFSGGNEVNPSNHKAPFFSGEITIPNIGIARVDAPEVVQPEEWSRLDRQHRPNIFMGVSVNKKLDKELWNSALKWAIEHGNYISFLVADDLIVINKAVIEDIPVQEAKRQAQNLGKNWASFLHSRIRHVVRMENLSMQAIKQNVQIVTWSQISSGERFRQIRKHIYEEIEKDSQLEDAIRHILESYLSARKVLINDSKMKKLFPYIINELATLIDGISIDSRNYDVLFYPTYVETSGMMNKLAMELYVRLKNEKNPQIKALIEIAAEKSNVNLA